MFWVIFGNIEQCNNVHSIHSRPTRYIGYIKNIYIEVKSLCKGRNNENNISANSLHGGVLLFRLSLRLMLGLWLLMTVVFINLYASTLTSYLTVTKLKPIPTSLEELVAHFDQQSCLLTMQKGNTIIEKFNNKVICRNIYYFQVKCSLLGIFIYNRIRKMLLTKSYINGFLRIRNFTQPPKSIAKLLKT